MKRRGRPSKQQKKDHEQNEVVTYAARAKSRDSRTTKHGADGLAGKTSTTLLTGCGPPQPIYIGRTEVPVPRRELPRTNRAVSGLFPTCFVSVWPRCCGRSGLRCGGLGLNVPTPHQHHEGKDNNRYNEPLRER